MKWRMGLVLLSMGGWLVGAASCGNSTANEWCDLVCKCEGCNDREQDDCVLALTANIDRADAFGCDAERADYDDCRKRQGDCNDNDWQVNGCTDYRDRLDDCIAYASAIIPDPGGPGGNTQCNCTCNCATCSQPWIQACPGGVGCESCDVGCPAVCAASACGAYVDNTGACF